MTTEQMWTERKARAIAFLKDKPKPGKPWSSKTYVYDKEPNNDNANLPHRSRLD